MASLIIPVLILLVIVAAVLHATRHRVAGCWLLVVFPASLCGLIAGDLSRGAKIGQSAIVSDQKQMAFCLVLLALHLLAASRPSWPWLFWVAWTLNACVCAELVYIAFFWKVFS